MRGDAKVPDEQTHEQDMNRVIREQLSRRREEAPQLLWPAEESTKDDDREDENDARDQRKS